MATGPLVEEDLDIGLYGDEPEEPQLPRKKVRLPSSKSNLQISGTSGPVLRLRDCEISIAIEN